MIAVDISRRSNMLALGNTQKEKKKNTIFVFIGLLLVLVLTACQSQPPTIEEPEPTSMPTATVLPPTDTLVPASPTSSPTVETYTDLIQYPGVFHIHRYLSVRLPEDGTPHHGGSAEARGP